MKNFTLITALILCSFSWISASVSESQTVTAKPGENVTLQCSTSTYTIATFWLRLKNRSNINCILKINNDLTEYCEGFKNRFEMSTNIRTVFLKIVNVDLSDSGLYLCGSWKSGALNLSVIHLNVEEHRDDSYDDMDNEPQNESDGTGDLTTLILGCLSVFLVMVIIGLVIKNRKLQTADKEEQNPGQSQNVGSDDLNYAAVAFRSKGKRRDVEPNVVYAATR